MGQKYHVSVGGKAFEFDVSEDEDGLHVIHGDGRRQRIKPHSKLAQTIQRADVDGVSRKFVHRRTAEGQEVVLDGAVMAAVVRDARAVQYAGLVKAPAGAKRAVIKAPMPGLAVTVLVKAGDTVAKDQTLLTLNAMKLENDIRSPVAGTVVQVSVEPGQAVEKGFAMVVVE